MAVFVAETFQRNADFVLSKLVLLVDKGDLLDYNQQRGKRQDASASA